MPSKQELDNAFVMLEQAAVAGARCPQSIPHGPLRYGLTSILARAGRIRVEIYMHNWRVVTIMEGPHKGKHTALSPNKNAKRPYKVLDKDDAPARCQQPWSPVKKHE